MRPICAVRRCIGESVCCGLQRASCALAELLHRGCSAAAVHLTMGAASHSQEGGARLRLAVREVRVERMGAGVAAARRVARGPRVPCDGIARGGRPLRAVAGGGCVLRRTAGRCCATTRSLSIPLRLCSKVHACLPNHTACAVACVQSESASMDQCCSSTVTDHNLRNKELLRHPRWRRRPYAAAVETAATGRQRSGAPRSSPTSATPGAATQRRCGSRSSRSSACCAIRSRSRPAFRR